MALPYKLVDRNRRRRYGVVANSFEGLKEKARKEFGFTSMKVVLESDGTEIKDNEYFETIERNTILMILNEDEDWVSTESSVNVRPPTAELDFERYHPRVKCRDVPATRSQLEENRAHFDKRSSSRVIEGRKKSSRLHENSSGRTNKKKSVERRESAPMATLISRRAEHRHDKRDRCIYCYEDVTNFSRHMFRKHSTEAAVVSILLEPAGGKLRKQKLDALRKKGNYTLVTEENKIRPKQRNGKFQTELVQDFVPCPDCKGIYRKNSLNRHVKICPQSVERRKTEAGHSKLDGSQRLSIEISSPAAE